MKWTNRINHDMIGYSNQIHNHSHQKNYQHQNRRLSKTNLAER